MKKYRFFEKPPPFFFELFLIYILTLQLSDFSRYLISIGYIFVLLLHLLEKNIAKTICLCIFLIPSLLYNIPHISGDISLLGKIVDRDGYFFTVLSEKVYTSSWITHRDYYQFKYNSFSTEPLSIGKDLYIKGRISDNRLTVEYAAPSNNNSIFMIKEHAIKNLSAAIKDKESLNIAKASIMGSLRDPDVFKKTGTLHLFAVSGMQVFIIYFIFSFVLNIFIMERTPRLIINSLLIMLYLVFTGLSPSSVRAALMLVFGNLFLLSGISTNSLNILGLIGYLNLLLIPGDIYNIGFQLSYSTTLMIITTNNYFNSFESNKNYFGVIKFLSISIAAFIGVIPFSIIYFGSFSLLGPLLTPFLEPIINIIMILSIICCIFPVEIIGEITSVFALSSKYFLKGITFNPVLQFNIPEGLFISGIIMAVFLIYLQKIKTFLIK